MSEILPNNSYEWWRITVGGYTCTLKEKQNLHNKIMRAMWTDSYTYCALYLLFLLKKFLDIFSRSFLFLQPSLQLSITAVNVKKNKHALFTSVQWHLQTHVRQRDLQYNNTCIYTTIPWLAYKMYTCVWPTSDLPRKSCGKSRQSWASPWGIPRMLLVSFSPALQVGSPAAVGSVHSGCSVLSPSAAQSQSLSQTPSASLEPCPLLSAVEWCRPNIN